MASEPQISLFGMGLLVSALTVFATISEATSTSDSSTFSGSEEVFAVKLIKARCTFCHSVATAERSLNRYAKAYGADRLDHFLAGHSVPDRAAREAILNYLQDGTDRPNSGAPKSR